MSTTTIRSAVARNPHTTAVVLGEAEVSYADLYRRANQLAWYLQSMGVGPEVRVGVLLERSVETIVTLLAIFRAGGAYVPLEPDYPDERLHFMARDAGLELVVTQARLAHRLGDSEVRSIRVDAEWAEIAKEREDNPPLRASAANLAYIIYTSGSSGTPKGAMVTRGGMLNCVQWMQQRYELTAQDSFLMHTSLNFDPSVWEVFWPLLVGGRVVIAPAGMLESRALLEYMADHSVTCAYFVPSQLGMLVQERGLSECRTLRYVISGGEKLPLSVMREFQAQSNAELHHSYGPTETSIAATEWTCEAAAERVLMGRPIANTQAYVLDGEMEPLPVGVAGEFYIGGVGVGRGYVGQARLTAERFVPDRFSAQPGARLYRTGDLVRYDAEGRLEFVGRVDQQVKLRGYRIELGEIEAVLRRHEAVREAVVVLHEAHGDKRLVAYVVGEVEAGALREYLNVHLPDYMVPSFFVRLEELPLFPNGKLNRRALPAPESVVVAEAEYVAPRTATEELLAGMWARVLRVNRVGINDNFFALGGHSLLATQVIARVRDAFGQEVALRSLFEQPTVAGLARIVEAAQLAGAGLSAPPLAPISRDAELPLSFAQQRLWFLDQLEASGSFYNLSAAVRLRGVLNIGALEQTLSEVVRRHEALRTTFVAVDGEPLQVIEPFTPVVVPVFDVGELRAAEREAETRRLLNEAGSQPFDLARGPLVRACLVRVATDEHIALVTMHHIISDGWSRSVFIREVAELYGAYVRGEESPLEELPLQYADFAHWQRDWLQGEVLAAHLDYWREALAEAPAMLELPTDRPRPREQTFNGATVNLVVPEELTGQLKSLSQRERVTLFMTLLAAFQSLLFRHSGQSDVVVGTPIANRRYRELEDLIGFFVNTLALRATSLSTVTFTELLQRVREVTLGAYAHQDLPFEKLVEELQPERDLSRNPIFQVMFAVQNAPSTALELPGLRLEGEGVESGSTRFDLECHLWEVGPALNGVFVYNTDLFDQSTIERLVMNYQTLLQSIAANATAAVVSLRLLRAEDERQLLYEWNETRMEFPREVVPELFAQQVARTPHATALILDGVSLTFAELNQRSNLVASYLQSKGVGPETVVGVMLERSVEALVAVLGVLKAGGAYLALDPEYPRERLQFMLADADVRVLLTQESLLDHGGGPNIEKVCLDTDWNSIIAEAVDENPRAELTSDNLAFIIYTSGSTGHPKGVAMTHRALVNLLHWQMRRSRPAPRTVQFASLSFDVSFQEIFSTWCAGGTLVLTREEARRDAVMLWELLIRERIERLFLPFVALQYLAETAEHQNDFPSALREVIAAGEQLKITRHIRSLFAKLDGCTLENHYGPSETHVVSVLRLEDDASTWPELPAIGRPMPNAQLYLLDEQLQVVPVGVAGELYIGGESVARGYLNRPAITAERFLPHPFLAEGTSRLYRTGDQARYLADGNIEFLGRRDQQVKVRGYRIELGEVEAALRQQEQVREAVVISGAAASGGNRLIAYVLTEKEATVTTAVLRDMLKELLPEYMVPAVVVLVDEFPLTPSGKIDRRALQARPVELEAGGASVAARTPAEEIVAAIWAEVLGRETIGVYDNFFELGGHSLLATQVISRVRDAFGQEVPLRSLFEQPTVAGLVESIEQAQLAGTGFSIPALVPISRDVGLPLSFAQQRLWFLDQLEPGNAFYNVPAAVRLRGMLNVPALEQTLSEVVRRHEALRTTFVAVQGKPRQVIMPFTPMVLPVFDVSGLKAAEREAEAQRLLIEEGSRPFDLAHGPVIRACLVRLDADEHVALVTMHHIISDGWSTGVFIREVVALYSAYVRGEESPLDELPIQYANFAHWQRGWLQGQVLAAHLDYWRETLADVPTTLELPTDRPRPREQTFNGADVSVVIPEELTAQLKALSQRERVTLFMTLRAAFQSLLFRHSGQEDIVVGTPIANRRYRELENLIGFFVNTLALRARSLATLRFTELLHRVREVTLGAYAHQDLPFEKLVEELQPERDLSRNPIFQVLFAWQNAPRSTLELPGLQLEGEGVESGTTRFDLECHLWERGPVVVGYFIYNTDLFDRTTIERLVVNFQTLLQSIVANPTAPVASLRLLRAEDERQLLYDWNETSTEYSQGVVPELFAQQVTRTPHATAVVFDGVSLTYAELNQRSNQLASYLRSKGVGADRVVGVMLERSVEMLVAVLGVLKAGGAYLPLDPEYPRERLQFMLDDAGVRVLLTQAELAGNGGADVDVVRLDTDWHAIVEQAVDEQQQAAVTSDNLAYVIYTSGSTGQPKGVAMTHRLLVNMLHWQMQRSARALRTLQFTSLSFDVSFQEMFATWCTGGTLVLMRKEARQDPGALWEVLIRERIERLFLPFVGLQYLAEASEHITDLPSTLREVITAGEQLKITRHIRSLFVKLNGCTLDHQYGPSETHVVSAVKLEGDAAAWPELPPIGRPIANVQIYLLDQRLQVAPVGVAGELYVGGEVARGYLNRPATSAERFLPHPFVADGSARLYRTGDQARYLADGNIEFLGRHDQQVKVRGYRIELGEVEAALRQEEQVREAVVVNSRTASGENRLIAYVLTEPETSLTTTALRGGLRELLPEYMIPAGFVLLTEFPLTPSGKIDRRALQSRRVEFETGGASVLPRTPAEEIVAAIWAEVLGRETIGVHDNFFELGGHSLLATQVISRVRDAFRQEVPLRSLFERPTVAGLTQSIEQQQRGEAELREPPLVQVTGAERIPLSFAQQRLWFLDQLEPGSTSYNLPASVRLRGVLNIRVLEQTLSEVVRRHEVLRTRFIAVDGEPAQVIDPAAQMKLAIVDLSALDEKVREADLMRLVRMEANLPFDLSRGPLLRVSLIRMHAEDHVAAVTMPHIVTDGWSMGIFINEVATLYAAYIRGDESPFEELPIQYADFAHWQRGWLQGEVLAAQLDYWRAELAGAPTVIDLPVDKPRPPAQTFRGAYQRLQLSTELSAQLRDLSRHHGSTLFMTLLAAFDVLLCRYAGQEQVLVGSPIANRNRSETEGLIGFFVNMLVFRGDVRGNPSFSELLRRVRETALSAYAHQDLPFEKLVEELQPERDMSRSPLFQVTFTWQNAPSETLELEGLTLSGVESAGDSIKFEVSLVLEERGGAIAGVMLYNRDLFEVTTIERLLASYERVLQAVVADAEQRVLEIELLSANERRQLIYGWNETTPALPRELLLSQLFEAQAARTPEAVALVFEGEQLSYAELDRRSNQLAHHLVSLGVSPDSLVAVCLDRSLELFIALLAILKAGAAYLPLDPSYPLARLSFMLADSGSPLLLTNESLADELPAQWTPPVLLDADWDLIAQNTDEPLPEKVVAADQLAYVMYTSGSTGTPKGVAVTHGGVVRLVTSPNYVRLDQDQTLLQLAPLTFDASTLEVWGALLNGACLVVMPPSTPSLDEISRVIVDQGVTTLWLTAGLFHLMVDEQLEGLSQVKQLLAGGDVLSAPHVEKYLAAIEGSEQRLINGYGPTENTTFTCCHVMDAQTRLQGSVPIGRPITNTQVYVLDAEMQVASIGVVGELYIGGAGLARGYSNQPELTAERFVPHPHSTEAGERLYRTGDMVRWRESGELEFIGRVDGQVKIRGFRIEVGEIEAVLAGHQGVREAVVLVRADDRGDKRLAAYVVKEAESEVTARELKDYLRERLPEYMQVQWVVEVAELPLTANGKVDRHALQALEVETAVGESVQARTPVEEILAAIWAEVLGHKTVSVHDNFFDLGGHSLLATQVISRVRDAFGQEVVLRSLFEQPTVAGLAREIEAGAWGAVLQAPPQERVERAERLPLSFAQQRLWFLDQLEPGSSFYNIPAAVRLHGVLNVEALERTLSEVVRRHEVLRTHFIAVDGEPVQVIEPAAPLKLEVLDLSDLNEAERTAETQRLIATESLRPFDLAHGPLLRVSLLRLGKQEHVALVMMHHIISDGWSIGVLVREVAALYSAYVRGEESPLEELAIQYADFAHWQRNWLQGEVLDAQLEYWRGELTGAPTVIDLPIDKPRPPVQTYRGAHQPLQLSAELSGKLRDLSRQTGSTLFMTLLAAFDLLLCRYAGQEQVLVGTPIANRNRSETEALIGFFVNTLVLRGDVRGNPSFRELLRRVREAALSAYAHQDLPFEKLVEELQPERDMSRSPLFQVMFVLQNAPGEALQLEGLRLSGVESSSDTAKFELLLGFGEVGDAVAGGITYNRDLYEAETIARLAASYERVLQAVVTDPEQRVFEIDLLSEAERRQIVEGWNEPQREYAPASTLSELFEAQAARTPEAVALRFENTTVGYRELNERANQLAWYLQTKGVGPEVLVGILMDRSVEMIVAVLGILKAGGAYVPLDPSYPAERLSFVVHDSGMRMLLTQERLREVPGGYTGATLSLTEQWEAIARQSSANLPRSAQPENVAYVIYTSGSTGRPKGVLVSHENVVRLLEATQPHFEFNQRDVWTLFHSYAFDFSVWEIWGALAYGGKLVVVPYWISRSAEAFHALLASEQVTVLNQTPSAFRQLIAADELAGEDAELKLRLVIFGGEALELQTLRPWFERHRDDSPRLVNMFGITETTVHVTYRPLTADDLELASSSVIGRPLECLQLYLLDERGQPVPIGVPGEICVGGTGLARGYLNRAELTAERFIPHPFSTLPGERLYRSGDLARYLSNGDIEYLGRIDQQVKVRGFRIELGEIEAALAQHEAVRECTVVANADANGETKLLAYLVARQQPAPSVTALREFLKEKLPEYMIPAAFTALDAMPLTPNGKIDRRALPAPDQARPELAKEFVAPRTAVEKKVAGIWEDLLDVRPIGVWDDFFSLGGHSLLAVRLMARIEASFGRHLPLASLFQGPTVEKQATLVQLHDDSASSLVGIQPQGEGLPFFCVHPGGGNVLCYRELANHLGLEQPFYGLQARGVDQDQVPHTRIEDMAAYYIEAIRGVQADGPYLLGGWSMGGVVAYEMAQQLEAQGERVELLALMDARPVTSVETAAAWDEIALLINFARDLGLSVDGLKLSPDELARLDAEELLSYVLQRAVEARIVPHDLQLAHVRKLFEVFKLNVQAMQSYRPQPSSTRVTLLKAGEEEVADETLGWGALTSGEVEIHTVPGSHFTIVREPYVRSLAEQLADCINRATLRSFVSHT